MPHAVLKGARELLLQCENCGSVHKAPKPSKVQVRVIVSKGEESKHRKALLSGIIKKDDELLIDDEVTGEVDLVRITSIEVGDKRKDRASAEDIKTIWARAIDEVIVKIAVSHRETTESIEMRVPGNREFTVGEMIKVNNREFIIKRIKVREGGFKSRRGSIVAAKNIRRIYADPGIREEPKKISKGGRVVIKKRESVWSLKRKETG